MLERDFKGCKEEGGDMNDATMRVDLKKTCDAEKDVAKKVFSVDYSDLPKKKFLYLFLKRIFDFISSLIVSIIILIPCLVIMVVIMIADPGNPFYCHRRMGKNGKTINVVKFRSMKKNADQLTKYLTAEQLEQYQREYKIDNDPRLLPHGIGEFIRKTSLDELPQIIVNICALGNMSVVGPRPVVKSELESKYTKEEQRLLLSVKPGLTGYWQAYARNNAKYVNGERQAMELKYCFEQSALMDFKIIIRSIYSVLNRDGAM